MVREQTNTPRLETERKTVEGLFSTLHGSGKYIFCYNVTVACGESRENGRRGGESRQSTRAVSRAVDPASHLQIGTDDDLSTPYACARQRCVCPTPVTYPVTFLNAIRMTHRA